MTLQQLQDFIDVVKNGGYRAAARELGRSQAVLTKSVARLEGEYSIALLSRGGVGSSLTPEGEEFLRYAQAILAESERAKAWLDTPRRKRVASVALGVSIEPSLRLVPSVLEDFRRALPTVTVRMAHGASSELVAGVRENRLDLAITRLPADWQASDLSAEVLYQAEPVVVARASHPMFAVGSAPDLSACDWVVVGDPSQPGSNDISIRELFDEHARTRPRIAAVTDSLFGAVSTLIESDCVARLPRSVLDHPLVVGRLASVDLPEPPRPYRVAIVRKPGRPMTREAQTLAAMLASFARVSLGLGRMPPRPPTMPPSTRGESSRRTQAHQEGR